MFRVGVDIGGTFTDTVSISESGAVRRVKVSSTPPDFSSGLFEGVKRLDQSLDDMALLAHGTTVGINAILSRTGAKTGLVTTKGFRDTLALRRGDRADQFNLWWQAQPAVVPRRHRFEVDERIDYAGRVVRPLDEGSVREVARQIREQELEAVAVVFINSFTNPEHERETVRILADELPDVHLSASFEILPEILEYERTATTALNAYIGPVVGNYVSRLESGLGDLGYKNSVVIGTSAGGVATPDIVRRVPARTLESGPAAGVMAAREIARLTGFDNVVTFDMGGTSLDLGIVSDGVVRRTNQHLVEWGTPVRFPSIDVFSIGAGGGSIAWIDPGGSLRNGPQSAGARPGPACYGLGGTEPTNTDAQLVLGRMSENGFLGGEMTVDAGLARDAIKRHVGDPLGLGELEAAQGMLSIAHNNMLSSVRLATVERGYDPRDFSLVAYGGAGPLYAAEVAREGNLPHVIVPRYPGLVSALGLLMVDLRHDLSRSILLPQQDVTPARLNEAFGELEREGIEFLDAENVAAADRVLERQADVRYFGQNESISVPVASGTLGDEHVEALFDAFEQQRMREYGYLMPAEVSMIEVVNVRVAAIGRVETPPFEEIAVNVNADDALTTKRDVFFDGEFHSTPIYERSELGASAQLTGPAIIEQTDSTTVVPPGATAEVDRYGNLILSV